MSRTSLRPEAEVLEPSALYGLVAQPLRRELKYVLPRTSGRSVAEYLRSKVPSLTTEHAPRRVNSAYFDSATYGSYGMSVAGLSQRLKVRLRWYGSVPALEAPILEVKQRLANQGWKSQCPIDGLDADEMTWPAIRAEIASQIPNALRLRLVSLRFAVLVVTYHRHYFTTTDRRIRVTVDTDLQFFDQRFRVIPNFAFDVVRADFAVVECKLAQSIDPEAARILESLGLRRTRFSKYCFGLESLSRTRRPSEPFARSPIAVRS